MRYYLFLAGAALLFAAVGLHLSRLSDSSMYRFRNVMIAAVCPFCAVWILSMLMDFPKRGAFTLAAFLLEFPPRFANLSIVAVVLLGAAMAVSNVVLIKHEGMSIKNTVGTMLELAWILATVCVYALACVMKAVSVDISGVGKFLCSFLPYYLYCMIDYGECVMAGIMIMGWVAARGKSAYDKDFIIIPGCCISRTGRLLPLLRGRVNRAMRYAWEQEIATGKPVYYIPSGGQGPDEVMSEGSAMGLYLMSHSAEAYEVFPEKESTNTAENFLFSARIAKAKNPQAKVAFATTNYHVLRCGMLARRAGLVAEGLASSTKWYFWPNGFAREVVAIVNMTRRCHVIAAGIIMALSLFICLIA